jgi:hypothetical protein
MMIGKFARRVDRDGCLQRRPHGLAGSTVRPMVG